MNRGERQHEEQRRWRRHFRLGETHGAHTPYVYRAFTRPDGRVKSAGYPGKVPGKLCSCETCGNPRRHFGDRTRQEIRATVETPMAIIADGDGEMPCACDECMPANDGLPDACRSTPLTVPLIALARVA